MKITLAPCQCLLCIFQLTGQLYNLVAQVLGLLGQGPTLGALFWRRRSAWAAGLAMIGGGATTVALGLTVEKLPLGLDANVFGLLAATGIYVAGCLTVGSYTDRAAAPDRR